jgi:hypothetical protein
VLSRAGLALPVLGPGQAVVLRLSTRPGTASPLDTASR